MFFSSVLSLLLPTDALSLARGINGAVGSITKLQNELTSLSGFDELNFVSNNDIAFVHDGAAVPLIYGTGIVRGQKIWSSDITVNQTNKRRYINIAYMICGGEIDSLVQVYHGKQPISIEGFNYRLYKGSDTQMPDPLTKQATQNDLAFRGVAYIVFENLDITSFAGNAPNLYFKVSKTKTNVAKLNDPSPLIKAINLIPGTGEFVLDTKMQKKIHGVFDGTKFSPSGAVSDVNYNTGLGVSDLEASLDNLRQDLPNTQWVSSVVCWFCDNLDASKASVYPAAEYSFSGVTSPDDWKVAGVSRQGARQISKDQSGRVNYGGTTSDVAVLRGIEEIKKRGYKVMFYPMIMMDLPGKPWRGHLTCKASDIEGFFNKPDGYNQFILHYAKLVKGKVDAFIIGSEMIGLTKIKGAEQGDDYPAVRELKNLAKQVKSILGGNVKVSYAADWSEYHHTDGGWYNLDPLWSDENIDFVGIDAYFPLTNTRQSPSVDDILSGFTTGEGYDCYYSYDRSQTYPLSPAYAWKDVRWFLQNKHYNPNGLASSWVPSSKKIWFVEYGFPSVDLCSNQPNVFYNPEALDGGLPRFSQGYSNFKTQQDAIFASETFFANNTDIIERAFLWAWDARPYPYFPRLLDVWSDGDLWRYGHWVNGKLASSNLGDIVRDICLQAGFKSDEVDTSLLDQGVEGFVINRKISFESMIKMLAMVYLFDCTMEDGILKFVPLHLLRQINIDFDDVLLNTQQLKEFNDTEFSDAKGVKCVEVYFYDSQNNMQVTSVTAGVDIGLAAKTMQVQLPVVMSPSRAMETANLIINCLAGFVGYGVLTLPLEKYSGLKPLDVLIYEQNGIVKSFVIKETSIEGEIIKLKGQGVLGSFFGLADSYHKARLEAANKANQTQLNLGAGQIANFRILSTQSLSEDGFYLGLESDSLVANDNLKVFASADGGLNFTKLCELNAKCKSFEVVDFVKNDDLNPALLDGLSFVVAKAADGFFDGLTNCNIVFAGELCTAYKIDRLTSYHLQTAEDGFAFYKLTNFTRYNIAKSIDCQISFKGSKCMIIDSGVVFVANSVLGSLKTLRLKLA